MLGGDLTTERQNLDRPAQDEGDGFDGSLVSAGSLDEAKAPALPLHSVSCGWAWWELALDAVIDGLLTAEEEAVEAGIVAWIELVRFAAASGPPLKLSMRSLRQSYGRALSSSWAAAAVQAVARDQSCACSTALGVVSVVDAVVLD